MTKSKNHIVAMFIAVAISLVPGRSSMALAQEEDAPETQSEPSREAGSETMSTRLTKCAVHSAPAMALGLGLVIMVASPLSPLFALAFAGGEYGVCYIERGEKDDYLKRSEAKELTAKSVEALKGDIKETFLRASSKIDDRAKASEANIDQAGERIKEVGDEQVRLIEKYGAKAVRELHEEIETLKNAEFEVKEETSIDHQNRPVKFRHVD